MQLSRWDYFQVSPCDEESSVPENDEDEKTGKASLPEKKQLPSPEPYEVKSNPVQKARDVSTASKNSGQWVVAALIFMLISASVIFYLSHTSEKAKSSLSQNSFSVLTVSQSINRDSESTKILQVVVLSNIEKEILKGKIYSETRSECQMAQMSEEQYNQFVNEYHNKGKAYFIEQYKAYALSKLPESKAAADSIS